MTKDEFKGFSEAAQHDMVLEALVRVTKNLETMEKENGKPFVGTVKQRRNDIKLLTILAEAFGKNELVWEQKPRVTVDAGKYMPGDKVVVAGVGMERYNSKSMAELSSAIKEDWKKHTGNTDEGKRLYSGIGEKEYMEKSKPQPFEPIKATDDKSMYPVKSIAKTLDNSGISKGVVEGFKRVSNERMAKRRSK